MTKVEQYEDIRRDHRLGGLSIRELSRKHKVHRRKVREALGSSSPAERKTPEREAVAFGAWVDIVTKWLEDDKAAPRKQRHTARRAWQRLIDEYGADISESTVRRCVAEIRASLDHNVAKVPIVQDHGLGAEAEVDFGEVSAVIEGELTKLNMFVMRLSASGKAFHYIYRTCDTAAFLDGHVRAFAYFGGIPGRIRYDNLKPAVIKVLIGRSRNENQRFVALRSHYGFDSFYCIPGIEGAHEKGGVEGEVGRFRRRYMVPVPKVSSLVDLNKIVASGDIADDSRHIEARISTVGDDFATEAPTLGAMTDEVFETGTVAVAHVDAKSRIMVRQCRYSVPVRFVSKAVDVLIRSDVIEIRHNGVVVGIHERMTKKGSEVLLLDHYLETLASKPGALPGSSALDQARKSGTFSETHERFWSLAKARLGDKLGTRALIGVLLLHRTMKANVVKAGIEAACEVNNFSPDVVAIEARRAKDRSLAPVEPITDSERPSPDISAYDELLEATR